MNTHSAKDFTLFEEIFMMSETLLTKSKNLTPSNIVQNTHVSNIPTYSVFCNLHLNIQAIRYQTVTPKY